MGRENHPQYYKEGLDYKWGEPQVLTEGKDLTIVTSGPLVPKALAAAEKLKEQGKSATVINNPFVNEPNAKVIGDAVKNTDGKLITLEDHQIKGGMGAMLCHALITAGYQFQAKSLGNPGVFGQSAYTADQLYAKYGMDENAVLEQFNQF